MNEFMVKVAFVGAGGIAAQHLKNLREIDSAEVVAISDINKAAAEQAAAPFGAKAYADFDTMLDNERFDALFVCVPPFAHGDVEEKAAARGIHMLVEKPIGLDMATVRKKAKAIREAGIIVSTGYCLRYLDTIAKAKEYLQGKEIGMVRAYRFGGLVGVPWWRDMSKSGGQLVEMTTHNVDMIRYLAGDITKVSADMTLRFMGDTPGLNIPDLTSVNFTLASGAIGHIDTGFIPQPDSRQSLEIMGRNFRLTLDGTQLTILEPEQSITYKSQVNFYLKQDEAFIRAVETGDRSLVLAPYEEAMKTLAVTLAANESAQTNRPIDLADF